ncbi:MAG TPA: serine/threonine-protein kinase [Kofleriaceae bacterium]|nr:serine/threonine-protein kinase [Kofleriaceae bacterium]
MSNYTRRKLLGKGAMGEVYASQDDAGRPVAVKNVRKTISMDRAMGERLTNEARLLERVMHHNVVRAVDSGANPDGSPYLVMSYAEGITLWQLVDREGPLPVQRAFAIASQILTGLAAIHDAKVVHADIKSNNILIDDADRVTIIDFGLARTLTRELPSQETLAGTPAFMAPEIVTGSPPSITADIYAVGAILYEMLTGITPFARSSDIFEAHLREPVVPPSLRAPEQQISGAIDRLVLRALSKSPDDRFPSARDFATALDEARAAEWRNATLDIAITQRAVTTDLGERATKKWSRESQQIKIDQTASGRVRDIIWAALDSAGERVDARDLEGAITALERGLSILSRLQHNVPIDVEAWRIESVLAALYDTVGRKPEARRLAATAYEHAQSVGCTVAIERTKSLVDRLDKRTARPPVRLARGSELKRRP